MASRSLKSFSQSESRADLLSRATSLLNVEVLRLQPVHLVPPGSGPRSGESLGNLLGNAATERSAALGPMGGASTVPPDLLAGSGASVPMDLLSTVLARANVDDLRRRASDFLETLLASLARGRATAASSYDDRVPLVRSVAPVQPGTTGSVTLQVENEEASPSEVCLYASNFVADSGYELPSLLVSIAPRQATLGAAEAARFEIKLAVPAQTPRGLYSGLVQATGCRYVKAVVTFEVL
jgi:hypothetical protein